MPKLIALTLFFLLSLLGFLAWLMPAAFVVERLPELRPAGHPLTLTSTTGRWWQGQSDWRWQDQGGELDWNLDWHGLVPGVTFKLASQEARAAGWLGADWGDWQLEQVRLSLPVPLVAEHLPQGSATGQVDATVIQARLSDNRINDLQGTLEYGGGTVSWGDESATIPKLDGRLVMEKDTPVLTVTDPEKSQLLHASLEEGRFQLQVMRAWPQLLGVSQGGNPSDVVFRMSQPVPLNAG